MSRPRHAVPSALARRGSPAILFATIVPEPSVAPIPVDGSAYAYRGVSSEEREQIVRLGYVAPECPLPKCAEAITLLTAALPRGHVLERKRQHMKSLSLQRGTAVWYATSGGLKDGWVARVRLPETIHGLVDGGTAPASFVADDRSEWIDPRHLYVDAHLLEWETMRARALVDQEILLVVGAASLVDLQPVKSSDARPEFTPWQYAGEREHSVRGAGFGPPILGE